MAALYRPAVSLPAPRLLPPVTPVQKVNNHSNQPRPLSLGTQPIKKYSSDKAIASVVRALLALGWRYQIGG
jgi:hypothetical protein